VSRATKKLRAAVFARAKGLCECGCRRALGESGHLDHFFGRAKAAESLRTCWALALICDDAKTHNRPSAAHWCDRFYVHAVNHGFHEEAERASTKIMALIAKGFAA
jgi:hypothetical protein